ncbi:MAG: ABC transporter ATP-binding protein [Candidatus Coprovivens sp.]
MAVIELKGISKTYRKGNEEVTALIDINFTFDKGKFYAIMGPSGSGKSTLISILGLMNKFDLGEFLLNEKSIKDLNDIEASKIRMKEIGFVFQEFYLDEYMSALDNVILPMLINKEIDKMNREKIAEDLLKKFNLVERKNHLPKELSGGEKQRVCIARALANNPSIILADEPTGDLDEKNEKMIFNYLKELSKEGKCVIVVSHSNEIKNYADILIELNNGKLVQ